MMPNKNRCLDGGYLVDGRHELPDDLTELYDRRGERVIGCNRLRCLRCGQMVVQQCAGSARRYTCACAGWLECGERPTSMLATEGTFDDAELPWRCAGHPRVTRSVAVNP